MTDIVFTKLPEIRESLAETDLSQLSDEEREQLMHLLGNICNEPEKYRDEFQNKLDEKIIIRHFDWADKHYNEADFTTDWDTADFFKFNFKFVKYMKKLLEEE